jgi:dipeptide/tripeptide permease
MRSPPNLTGMPPGVPYIIGNEAAERFSYYGMKSVLTVFMAHYILNQSGVLAPMNENESYMYTHLFVFGVYFLPVLGAILADGFLGKYRTILSLSLVYCLGNLTLACMATSWGIAIGQRIMLLIGLILICLGAGELNRVCRQRWRSVRRIEQASALKDVWLVLFLDQRRLLHLFDSLSMAPCESEVGDQVGRLEFPV